MPPVDWSEFEAVDTPKADTSKVDWSDFEPVSDKKVPTFGAAMLDAVNPKNIVAGYKKELGDLNVASDKEFIPEGSLTFNPNPYDEKGKFIPSDMEKIVRPFATPKNALIALATGGSSAVARAAAAYFGVQGVKGTVDAAKVILDPNASHDEKQDAGLSMFVNVPMALGGAHGATEGLLSKLKTEPKPTTGETSNELQSKTEPEQNRSDENVNGQGAGRQENADEAKAAPPASVSEIPVANAPTEAKAAVTPADAAIAPSPGPAKTESAIKRYPSTDAAKSDAVELKPGQEAPVKFVSVQPRASHIGWYEPTKPFVSNDGGLYYPNENGTVKLTSGQIKAAGFNIPDAELQKFKEAGGTEKATAKTAEPTPIVDQMVNNPEKPQYGLAERVRDERAKAGVAAPVESGQGIDPKASLEQGRADLEAGSDPEAAMKDFEKTQRFNQRDVGLFYAQGEKLAKQADAAMQKFGRDSQEYKDALKTSDDWEARTKAVQTEWAKSGHAQQGSVDLDTGSFTQLAREFKKSTGKDFTPKQAAKAESIANTSNAADTAVNQAQAKLFENTEIDPKVKSVADRIIASLDKTAAAALERIKARRAQGRLMAGIDPVDLADHAIYGASKIAKGVIDFSRWSAEMVKDLGEDVKPYLKQIWDASDKHLDELSEKGGKGDADAVKRAVKKTPFTPEKIKEVLSTHEPGKPFSVEQVRALWSHARDYLNKGADNFDDIRNKMATDLGMNVKDVTRGLTQSQTLKRLADDVWLKQRNARRLKEDAKIWLRSANDSILTKLPKAVMREAFNLKVLGHLSVGLGTHAPALAFQPNHWGTFLKNYGRMWKVGLSTAGHEAAMQDLMRRENYTTARRAGLENDPFQHEEYNIKGLVERVFPNLTHAGNRAYDVLHILRQDVFDSQWDKLSESQQTPEMASSIADSVNHVTGIVKKSPFGAAGKALFAPRLLASRYAWIYGDPAKAAATGTKLLTDIFKDEKTVTPEQKHFAIQQVREKATVVATMGAMLALNQAILTASGSKQKINWDDPTQSDWLKFKGDGLAVSFGNAMLTTARLPIREAAILLNNTTFAKKGKRFEAADRGTYEAVGEYFRNQLNPAVGDIADVALQNDPTGRPLPWSRQKVPAYLQRQGIKKPYTWGEWARDAAAPIPFEEPMKQVFDSYGMPKDQAEKWTKIIGTAIYMGGTGGRISEDTSKDVKH